jgi:selenocysteine lyase/cysteine desulfurase
LPPTCPDSPEWYAQMASSPLPPCDAATLRRRLCDEYRIEVPLIEWPALLPQGGTGNGRQLVRVSIQAYNTVEDVDAAAAGSTHTSALGLPSETMLQQVGRWEPLRPGHWAVTCDGSFLSQGEGQRCMQAHFWYCVQNHKWLSSPPGSAFLYARPEVQHLVEPLVISWGWEPERTNLLNLDRATSRLVLENEWQGTRDPAAYLSVPAAIQFQAEHDWPRVRAECHELLREARWRVEELTGLPSICPDSPEWFAQMAAFPLPACDAGMLQRRLYDEYRVEVPIIEWGGRLLVRVSVQGYNTEEDVDALVDALRAVLPQMVVIRA